LIYLKSCISYNQYALQKTLKKRKRSSYFFNKSVKIDFGSKAEPTSLLGWILSGQIGGKHGQSRYRLAQDRGKQRQQAKEEHLGDDRGEHRGASRGAAGNSSLTILVAGSR